ncbi:BMP family ABC transporter substrate-binding protein [Mycoplasma sp. NEAQ87857]|uniref:BMP family ABC transporter substrate-binding protein n=1 Tax=Mycoplasma sp. NEAQ87857 TaxID=2683967 RepID=UPI00131E561F|nr:BMP family ABC transporter substrate-binding protein [Mycoplasma sp. NEAQ87857]
MSKLKRILLTLTGTVSAVLPIAVSVSCGSSEDGKPSQGRPSQYIQPDQRVAKVNANPAMTAEVAKAHPDAKLVYITDSGQITDKSFNQSSWEALNLIDDQTSTGIDYKAIQSEGQYEIAYNNALADGRNVWILSGFGHGSPIAQFIKAHVADMKQKNIKIIIVDTKVSTKDLSDDQAALDYVKTNVYSVEFLTQQAAYVVGYASSQYLADKYATDAAKRKISMFGGGAEPGVTNFITGFLRGMLAWNKANADKKVTTNSAINLDSGFVPGSKMNQVIQDSLQQNPSFVMAVAGPATSAVIKALSDGGSKYSEVSVVGVDVDQSLADQANKKRYATSITKNLAQAVYDVVLKVVYGLGTSSTEVNHNQIEGLLQNWVGYAPSQLSGEDKAKMDNNLQAAKAKYEALENSEKEAIISNKLPDGSTDADSQTALVNALAAAVNS